MSKFSTIVVVLVVLLILALIIVPIVKATHRADVVITIDNLQPVAEGDDGNYLIWATREDGSQEVFECTDSLYLGKFNSSDVYGQLEVGSTYKVQVAGFRWPFRSWYRNIIKIYSEE